MKIGSVKKIGKELQDQDEGSYSQVSFGIFLPFFTFFNLMPRTTWKRHGTKEANVTFVIDSL